MSRRPRGKLSRLPLEQRMVVIDRLLNGATYDDVRQALRAAGAPERAIPVGDASFTAFMGTDEYRQNRELRTLGQVQAQNRKILFDGIEAGGGLPPVLQAAVFSMQDSLLKALSTQAIEPEDLPKVANAITRLGAVTVAFEKLRMEQNKQAGEGKGETRKLLTPEEAMARLREAVGL